ncbi:MAG: ParA family protein [Chloroflexi bacterium]|nr:ParA family protein [Chloroflexota bacterium]
MKVFAFANQKGGVGKTTTAVTLADGLSRMKVRTLLVDLDPQGHVALSFGLEKSPGLYRLVCLDESLSQVKITVRPNLDLITSDKQTEKVKRQITLADFSENILSDILRDAPYDAVLLDMAPSLDVLHINGLIAADWVVIPTRLDALAVDGVKEILTTLGEITRSGHRYLGYSILPTFFDRTTRETLIQFQELTKTFVEHIWPPIPQDTRVRETAAFGKTIWEYSPNSPAVEGYGGGRQKLGGYRQVLGRMMEVIHG